MALLFECMGKCCRNMLDTADIVRDACSIKGNVKENIPPSTGREELFLPSSPCPLCEMLGCAVLPLVLGFLQLFHLGSCIFISSDDADQSLKLSKPYGCACQPWIYLRRLA